MERINEAISMAWAAYKAEFGDTNLQDGEEFATVFNDGVISIGLENGSLSYNVLMGKPYIIDHTVGFEEMLATEEPRNDT